MVGSNKVAVTCEGRTSVREFYNSGESVYLFDESGDTIEFTFQSNELTIAKRKESNEKEIRSPMPGTLVKMNVKKGDVVKKGTLLFIM